MDIIRKLWLCFINTEYSIASLIWLLFFRKKLRIPQKKSKELYILVNGPSLNEALEKYGDKLKEKSIMCVNMMACTDYFEMLKPRYYTIADIKFWNKMKNCDSNSILKREQDNWDAISNEIVKKTKWHMYLFLPNLAQKNDKLVKKLASNSYLHPVYLNSGIYDFKGFDSIHLWCLKHQFCTPNLQNVLVLCLYVGILMHFDNLYILGCDHTFFEGFYVDNNNKFSYRYKHSYDTGDDYKVAYNSMGDEYSMGMILHEYADLWDIYSLLDKFAKKEKVCIYNCTDNSLIDIFKRKKIGDVI